VPALIANLNDDANLVRCSAIQALGRFGRSAAVALPQLLILANSSYAPERCVSVQAISEIGLPEGFETVLVAANDGSTSVRHAALNGLGYFLNRSAEVVPLLVGVLEREPCLSKWNALRALGRLGPLAKEALPAIRKWETRPNEVGGEPGLRKAIEEIEGRGPIKTSN
jgi:HEAT repeat protein